MTEPSTAPLIDRLQLGSTVVDLSQGTVDGPRGSIRLTALELAFLRYLAAKEGRVASHAELLEHVWGYHPSVASRAVALLVTRLRKKLEADPRDPTHILTVFRAGYRLRASGHKPARVADVPTVAELDGPDAPARMRHVVQHASEWLAYCDSCPPDEAAPLLVALAYVAFHGNIEVSVGRLLEVAEQTTDPTWAVRCATGAVRLLFLQGAVKIALQEASKWHPDEQAAEHALEAARLELESATINVLLQLHRRDEAHRRGAAALRRARRSGDHRSHGMILDRVATVHDLMGDHDTAKPLFQDAIDQLTAAHATQQVLRTQHNLAVAHYHHGQLDEAKRLFTITTQAADGPFASNDVSMMRANIAAMHLAQFEFDEVHAIAASLLPLVQQRGDDRSKAVILLHLGRALLGQGRFEEALVRLTRSHHVARHIDEARVVAHNARYIGVCCAVVGRCDRAKLHLSEALEFLDVDVDPLGHAFSEYWLAQVEGRPCDAIHERLRGLGVDIAWVDGGDPVPPGPWAVDVLASRWLREHLSLCR